MFQISHALVGSCCLFSVIHLAANPVADEDNCNGVTDLDNAVSMGQSYLQFRALRSKGNSTLSENEFFWNTKAMPILYGNFVEAKKAWAALANIKSQAHQSVINEYANFAKYIVALTTCLVLFREILLGLGLHFLSCQRRLPVQVTFVVLMLIQTMDFSFLIPVGYDLALQINGGSAASSGWLISFNNAGVLVGSCFGWALCKVLNHRMKRQIVVMAFCACAAVYIWLAMTLLSCTGRDNGDCKVTFEVMLGTRLLIGFMQGITIMYNILARELTLEEEQVSLSLWENFSLAGGVCLGPCVFSLTVLMVGDDKFSSSNENFSAFDKVAAASCTFAIIFVVLGIITSMATPLELKGLETCSVASTDEAPTGLVLKSLQTRRNLWILGMVLVFLGAFGLPAVEAGSSLLLETRFGWKPDTIGFALGCSFGIAAIISVALSKTREQLSNDLQALVGLSLMGFLGSLVFVDMGLRSATRILIGNCMVYPALLTVNGLIEGYLYILAWPGTWYSTDRTVLATMVLDQAGRFLTMPLTRGILENVGQTCYALAQATLVFSISCLGYVFVHKMEGSGLVSKLRKP